MNKIKIMEVMLNAFGMLEPTVSQSPSIKRTMSNESLYNRFEKAADILVIMGQIEYAKGERAEMVKRAKEIGINL